MEKKRLKGEISGNEGIRHNGALAMRKENP